MFASERPLFLPACLPRAGGLMLGPAHPAQASLLEGAKGPQILIGLDDDRQDNAAIHAGAATNQSLDRTEVLEGALATT